MTSPAEAPVSRSIAAPRYRPLPPPSALPLSTEPFPAAPPAFVFRLGLGIRRFLRGLMDALTPAELVVFERATGVVDTGLIGAIARHEIADLLEERGPLNASAIAAARSLDADAVHRTLRASAAMGLFRMLDDGR